MVDNTKIDWLGRFYSLFLIIMILGTLAFLSDIVYSILIDSQVSLFAKSMAVIFGITAIVGSAVFLNLIYNVLWKAKIKEHA